jgi:hypothetical protein
VFSRVGRKPRSGRSLSLPAFELHSKLRKIVLVVVVLVLDLLRGFNRSARLTPAARFGRSLSLPAFELHSKLRTILLVVVVVLVLDLP